MSFKRESRPENLKRYFTALPPFSHQIDQNSSNFLNLVQNGRIMYSCLSSFTLCLFYISLMICGISSGEHYVVEPSEVGQLLCRRCGHEIAGAKNLHRRMPSTLALRQRNDTIVGVPGVLIQLFENPAGERFEVIVAEKADVYQSGTAYGDATWFPDYTWKIAQCPSCGAHLGWFYEPQQSCKVQSKSTSSTDDQPNTCEMFIGLILDNILSADFANTLTIVPKPKAFRSF